MACFGSACKLGFDEGLVIFNRGYMAGFQNLTRRQQDELVGSYMLARRSTHSPRISFVEHVMYFMTDMPELKRMVQRRISLVNRIRYHHRYK